MKLFQLKRWGILLAFVACVAACGGGAAGARVETDSAEVPLPRAPSSPDLSGLVPGCVTAAQVSSTPLVVGHRGYPVRAPENTMASYRAAAAAGAKWVEADVQLTRDGALVLMHDVTLERTTDVRALFPNRGPWRVAEFDLAEIRQLDAGRWFASSSASERVPTLPELLSYLQQAQVGLMLELKSAHESTPGKVAAALAEAGWVRSEVPVHPLCVNAFYLEHMRKFHTLLPYVEGQIIYAGPPTESEIASLQGTVRGLLVQFGSLNESVLGGADPVLRTLGVYTVNTAAQVAQALRSSTVKMLVTDDFAAVKGLLDQTK